MDTIQEERAMTSKKPRPSRITLNIGFTKYEIVKHVGKILKWTLSNDKEDENWDVLWTDMAVPPERLAKMKQYQKINHFPGMYNVSRKNYLAYNLLKLKKIFPDEYDFFPRTWVVPCDMGDLKAYMQSKKNSYFIVKPEASCQGRGIFLTKKYEEIDTQEKHVIQEYIDKPFLIDGLKFDLRIYVLVAGCDPLRIFIHDQGLTRFATETYKKPNEENYSDMCMHLTNYAVNKNNPNFIHNEDPDEDSIGHKRSLQSTYDYLSENNYDVDKLKRKIDDMVIKTLCSVQPNLKHHYNSCQPDDYANSMCFELLGFDIILDSKLNPYVLEVNHTPSFTTDSPLDFKVKEIVISEALEIMNIAGRNKRAYLKKQKEELQKRALTGKIDRDSKTVRDDKRLKCQIKRDRWEERHHGNYRRIFPGLHSEKYEKMIQAADDIYQEWTGTKINRVSKKIEENKVPIIKHIPKPPSKPNLAKIYDNDPLKVRANTAYLPDIESPSTSNLQDTKNYMPVFERLSKPHVRKTKLNTQQYLPGIVYHDDKKPNYAYGSKYCLTFQPEKTGITKFKMIEALEFREKPSLMKAQTEIYKKTDRNSLIKILASNTSSLSQLKPKTIEFVDDRSKKWN